MSPFPVGYFPGKGPLVNPCCGTNPDIQHEGTGPINDGTLIQDNSTESGKCQGGRMLNGMEICLQCIVQ